MSDKQKRWKVYSLLINEEAEQLRKTAYALEQDGQQQAAKDKRQEASELLGNAGETMLEKYMDASNISYEKIPQKILHCLPKNLKNAGGKRPDYLLDIGDPYASKMIVLADAKHYSTAGNTSFRLSDDELNACRATLVYWKGEYSVPEVKFLFILWPQEAHFSELYFIDLDLFTSSNTPITLPDGKTGQEVQLNNPNVVKRDIEWDKL